MLLTLISACLLILCFPKFSFWPIAWFSFVPIFFSVRKTPRLSAAFFHFYLFGVLFFFVTWEWLRHVSYFGWLALVPLYALYFGAFGILTAWFWNRGRFFLSLFALPSAWAVLEWIRTEIPVWGFGWNLLAYSQSPNLNIAGIARFVGAYGVSWLLMFANLTVFFLIDFWRTRKKSEALDAVLALTILALIFGGNFFYQKNNSKILEPISAVRIALIQSNIPQEHKWDPRSKSAIIETHEQLSRLVTFGDRPDLIIWPEAAFPGYFNKDPERARVLALERELKIPILLGSPHFESLESSREISYNSAYLVDHRFAKEGRYDKIRLVSFGEYVPWRRFFNLFGLERFAYSLGVSDFEAGKEEKVFSLEGKSQFSVLICFEDTFPFLARRSVEQGAQFLVVITNDAWFSKSAAAYQHLQASIFRAIENGVPLVRSANTGVSAFIDRYGKVLDRVKDQEGHDTFIMGGLVRSISPPSEKTFYRTAGYQLPIYCLVFVLLSFILIIGGKTK
ncbi:MAG: apolipoprotein N-acyltransferase [Omnitrophica bacterium RIFCSPHIGHO2_02_FULL_46_11]|nr:MAG: apolipoprotein N-acyltransferase [Omnitrophica bacterium RIFCSPLOWO2_01_FULL_45_10b]OGW87712.1 MAG: apolipoprotein N-acyltransferase [Omnitrophica bacterium RIFCSPHIGHO2_02_FULL_46_11]